MGYKDNDNPLLVKSKKFAIRIIKMVQHIRIIWKEYTLSDQILRSGTSIGANSTEGVHAASKADFYAKLNIAYKEATETQYWLELLVATDYLTSEEYDSMSKDCNELVAMLAAITKTQKQ